jgi:CDP-glycerol glycerophosphotransferase (TagB/SpsB family)
VVSQSPAIAAAHARVVAMLTTAAAADPGAGHEYRPDGDVLALFPRVDLLVSDISSVGLDFLYARVEAPIALTDRRTERAGLLLEAPIAAASHVLDAASIGGAQVDLARLLAEDPYAEARRTLRHFYFDDVAPGESTRKFHEALLAAINEHQAGVAQMREVAAQGTWAPQA